MVEINLSQNVFQGVIIVLLLSLAFFKNINKVIKIITDGFKAIF